MNEKETERKTVQMTFVMERMHFKPKFDFKFKVKFGFFTVLQQRDSNKCTRMIGKEK